MSAPRAIRPRRELTEIDRVLAAIHGSDDEDEDDQPIELGLDEGHSAYGGGARPRRAARPGQDLEPDGGWPSEQ